MHVLFADDDADDRFLMKLAIAETHKSIILRLARNGEELMGILKTAINNIERLPDLILLDLNMPRKNGKECLYEIRDTRKFDHIPVVIYSTSSSQKDIDDTYRMGANIYLEKPSLYSELTESLSKILYLDWSHYMPQPQIEKFKWRN
jgi:CheY-like chemotaxis protein